MVVGVVEAGGGGGVVGVVSVVVVVVVGGAGSAGVVVTVAAVGALVCALGSWVESVVTSVTGGGTGLGTVEPAGSGVGEEVLGWLGIAASATVLGAFFAAASLVFLARWRRVAFVAGTAARAPAETVTGWATV